MKMKVKGASSGIGGYTSRKFTCKQNAVESANWLSYVSKIRAEMTTWNLIQSFNINSGT